jgi:hypothetical protein
MALRIPIRRALPFVITADHRPHVLGLDADDLRSRLVPSRDQMDLFASTAVSARTGEL